MARAPKDEAKAPVRDEHHLHGGSYVNNEAGTRTLVERTEQVVIRNVDEANPAKKPK